MPIFRYRQVNQSGRGVSSTIIAESPRQARDILRSQGIHFESLVAVDSVESNAPTISAKPSQSRRLAASGIHRIMLRWIPRRSAQVSWFVREMATLLRVGTPMVDAIQLSIDQSRGHFRYVLQDIREQINTGTSLGQAVRRHPSQFDNILCELITVGEQAGALQSVLQQAAEFRERRDKLKDRVFSAMLYPSLVLCLSIAVSIFLMTVVTPTLIASLEELNHELPLPTRILKACSDFLLNWGIYVGAASLALFIAAIGSLRIPSISRQISKVLLRTPLLGSLIVKQDCSRLCMVTATLLRSGVELVRALEIAQESVSNRILSEVVAEARTRIASGAELSQALQSKRVFPAAMIQIFSLGQNTGELDNLLFQVAHDYDHQVGIMADRLTTILEPALIIGLSVVVGFILMATLLPILETGNALSNS